MSESHLHLIPAFAGGIVLGALFFAGLWLSVQKLRHAKRPGLLMLVGYAVRMMIVVSGFYLLSNGDWHKLVAALAGFILARILIVRMLAGHGQRSIDAVRGEH